MSATTLSHVLAIAILSSSLFLSLCVFSNVLCQVYEYQRWLPVRGWGTVLLPTDPGKWSDASQSTWGSALSDVAPPLPAIGWSVTKAWAPLHASSSNSGGWEYSTLGSGSGFSAMKSSTWAPTSGGTRTVRRRVWHRTVTLDDAFSSSSPAAAAARVDPQEETSANKEEEEEVNNKEEEGRTSSLAVDAVDEDESNEAKSLAEAQAPETSPLSQMAVRVYAKLLFYCMNTQPNNAGGALDLLLAMEKESVNGPSVVSLLLSELIAEIHADLLARSMTGSAAASGAELEWVTAMRASPLWENLRELSHIVSVRASKSGVALNGVPGAKRAILQQRRIGEVKSRMTLEQLHRCHYKCSEDRHKNICYFTTDVCSQCHHALAAHDLVPRPDPFKSLRRRIDDEILASEVKADSKTENARVGGDNASATVGNSAAGGDGAAAAASQDDNSSRSRNRSSGSTGDVDFRSEEKLGPGASSLLASEYPLLGGYDRGVHFLVATADPSSLHVQDEGVNGAPSSTTTTSAAAAPSLSASVRQHSAKWPLPPLKFSASGPERHMYMSLQLNHLMDLVLFPTDSHAESTSSSSSVATTTTNTATTAAAAAATVEEQGSGEDLLRRLCTVRMRTCTKYVLVCVPLFIEHFYECPDHQGL